MVDCSFRAFVQNTEEKSLFDMHFHILLAELNQGNANIWRVFRAYGKFKDVTVGGLLLIFSILPVKLFFENVYLWGRSSGVFNGIVSEKTDELQLARYISCRTKSSDLVVFVAISGAKIAGRSEAV